MVTFKKDGFVVEVYTACNPISNYVETLNGIVGLLQAQANDIPRDNYFLLEMLKEMLPTEEQAMALYEQIKEPEPEPEPAPEAKKERKELLYVV